MTSTTQSPTSSASTPVSLDVRRVSGALGAEIRGVDLCNMTDEEWQAVRQAWLEHLVVFFPDQRLTPEAHVAMGRRLGEIEIHPFIPKLSDEFKEIVVLDSAKGARADVWHTDVTFSATPPLASILNMVMMPATGGDTIWTNQYLAYEELSDPLKDLLDGLTAVHHAKPFGHPEVQAEHPVVRVHPETGRKVLYVNRSFTSHIPQMRRGESDLLLQHLYSWSEQPMYQVRYQWSEGTVGWWDNRCTMHYAVNDYREQRIIQRVTVLGDQPVGAKPIRYGAFDGALGGEELYTKMADQNRQIATDERTNSITTS